MASADKVLKEALALDERDRARVARELLRSLSGDDAPDAGDDFDQELLRRLAEVESGDVRLEDWDDVRSRLSARRGQTR